VDNSGLLELQKGSTVSSVPSPSDKISCGSEFEPQRDGTEGTVDRLNEALVNDQPTIDQCFLVARECLKAGDYRGAGILYRRAAEIINRQA
jgi:hypothetical protein